ncbi:hypothetical protein LF934_18190 [Dickeya dadantii]|uniref:hypothetical protein n=1 Tax=Dickeya dadantii TaxID=204038 RepID=UPI001CF203C8|nr:hypothetical protein [Dickeya dadantii]MCA7014566.1 hypothetical protein [Dickeya dadantii]
MKELSSRHYGCYTLQQHGDAPQESWLRLCHDVTLAHRTLRQQPQTAGYRYLTLCEGAGNTPLRYDDSLIGLGVITFNGCRASQQAGDTFVLCRSRRTVNGYSCQTDGHPYSFLVRVVLLLAQYHCPDVWQIKADIPPIDWLQAQHWIIEHLQIPLVLPEGSNVFIAPDADALKGISH